MTEHCNTSENLMVLAAHRGLSIQLFHMVVLFDPIGDWTGFEGVGDIRTLPTRAFVISLTTSSNEQLGDFLEQDSYTLLSLWITFTTAS